MTAAYVDSSFLLAIVFGEPEAAILRRILDRYDNVFSSDLLIAECISAAARERHRSDALPSALAAIEIVLPSRSLEGEFRETLRHGHLRGADLGHIGCALFLGEETRRDVAFLSRDTAQRKTAAELGFPTP